MKKIPFVACFLLLATCFSISAQDSHVLVAGDRVSRSIKGTEVHRYTIDLEAGMFVYGEADQKTVDVVVTVYDPDSEVVETFDEPARGPEAFTFESVRKGTYRIDITPFEEEEGQYVIVIHQTEPKARTPAGKVDQLMAAYHDESPGSVIAVVERGNVFFARGYGLANLEYGIPNTPDTPYHMASISKQFTAYAIVMLAQEGLLAIDDPVHKHVPELFDFGKTITLRHLLNHTSGLRDHWSLWGLSGGLMDDVIRQGDLLRLVMLQRELNFPPGSEYMYSNTGYLLLSEVVTRVSGKPFGMWMKTNVFDPLEMNDTQIYDDHERIVRNRAYSYSNGGEGHKKAVLSYANSGATSLFTTANDLALWLKNMKTRTVGGPNAWTTMQERGILNNGDTLSYALGVAVGRYRGLKVIQHGGSDAGFRTYLAYYPEIDAGVIVFSNLSIFNSGQVANKVADAFFGDRMNPVPLPAQTQASAATVSQSPLASFAGQYLVESLRLRLNVTLEGENLMVAPPGETPAPLVPVSDTLFSVAGLQAQVSFHAEADGTVTRGTLDRNGVHEMVRVDPEKAWGPDESALAAYAGRYDSAELETFYRVLVENGKLVLRHRRRPDIPLAPKSVDLFGTNMWFLGDLKFERDESGRVTGMKSTSGRIRNLRFDRQTE